ncbi:MAG: MerR family DNA-binding transcriptional regulator, partial [Conexibacter sp.]
MRYLKTSEAAALLNVSPNTLRAWERRFGFPRPQRSPGRHRLYTHGEIAALRDALLDGLSISSAVSRAREGLGADTNALVGALNAFDGPRADAAIEGALALRSLDRTVQEVLLNSLDEVARRHGTESVQWAFAARWGNSWLRRAQRLVAPGMQSSVIVLGDASRDELDPDAAYIRALEL